MPTSSTPFFWKKTHLAVLDQRLLPQKIKFIKCYTPSDVARVIKEMAIRGAPAIGCAAAYGMVLAAKGKRSKTSVSDIKKAAKIIKQARPTAVNLSWAVIRVMSVVQNQKNRTASLFQVMLAEAKKIEAEDNRVCKAMAQWGAKLFKKKSNVLTHCNAGGLATAGVGTALGVIKELNRKKKLKKVWVDETRPYLQGARLTAWECVQARIPHELISDNMAAFFMGKDLVDGIIVGCDRVAANGDTANKIGTYGLAVLAQHHKIPFYVAMPTSTLDLSLKTGKQIPIEERSSEEVVNVGKVRIAPQENKSPPPRI